MSRLLLAEIPDLPVDAFKHIGDKRIKPQGGGGGGSQTVSQVTIPKELIPYIEESIKQAQKVSALPYVPYRGERIAQFTPEQLAVQRGVMGLTTPGEYEEGAQGTRQAGQMAMTSAQRGLSKALGYTPGTFSGATAQYYMSPYQQGVTDSALREAQRTYDMESRRAALQAGARGSLGSSAQALREAEAARNIGTLRSDIQAKGSQAGYEQAQAQFERDRAAAALSAQLSGQVGQYGLGQTTTAAGQMADIASARQAADLQRLQAQKTVGEQIQKRQQDILSLKYEDFLRQQGYPREMATYYSNIVRGLPIQNAGTTTTTSPTANMYAQGLGTLLQLAGSGKLFG
jgi:hypothetical protein